MSPVLKVKVLVRLGHERAHAIFGSEIRTSHENALCCQAGLIISTQIPFAETVGHEGAPLGLYISILSR